MMDFMFVYDSVIFLHILAAAMLVATSLLGPVMRTALRRAPTVGSARTTLEMEHRVTMVNPLAALIVLGTGLYLGSLDGWPSGWFTVSLIAFIANSIVAAVFLRRLTTSLERTLIGAAEAAVPAAAERERWSVGWDLAGAIMLANDAGILYLMIRKPDLTTSIAIAVAVNAVLALAAVALRRRPASACELNASAAY